MLLLKSWVLVVGAGFLQIPAIKKAKERGFAVAAVDKSPQAPGFLYADLTASIDIYDVDKIINWCRETIGKDLAGVMTMATDCSYSVSRIAFEFGLPCIPPEAARISVNKDCFREILKKENIFVPDFVVVKDISSAEKISARLNFPVVVKPVDSMGGRGIKKVSIPGDIEEAARVALSFSRGKRVVLEEFLIGPEFSLDACMISGKCYPLGFSDRFIDGAPFFVETGYSMPSVLNRTEREEMVLLMERAARAIGIDTGIVKGDLKKTDNGPVLLEMAVRLSGNRMSSDAIPISCGIDAIGIAFDMAVGKQVFPPDIPIEEKGYVYKALCPPSGVIRKISGLEEAREKEGIVDIQINIKEGEEKKTFTCSADSIGYLIAVGETREIAERRARETLEIMHFDIA